MPITVEDLIKHLGTATFRVVSTAVALSFELNPGVVGERRKFSHDVSAEYLGPARWDWFLG